ncbi:MAG TPA: hypothetical protein VHZ51_09175 [Ktedonobacteraceae bacterium]|jgi:uncharacterized membrane protein SirB2|nr:hypothetical protein [Ktedonobacteraceae bacterium]
MAPFMLMILLSSALIIGGMILHMRIRSHARRRLVKRAPHLHDVIFARTTKDAEDDWMLLA